MPKLPLSSLLLVASLLAGTMLLAGEPEMPPSHLAAEMDPSIPPGDDFYTYANGAWLKAASIPADQSSFNVFSQLRDLNQERVAKLIRDTAASAPAKGTVARQVADYYQSVLDETGVESKGLTPLHPTLRRIEAITDGAMLAHFLGTTLRADVDILNATRLHTDHLFGLWVAQDLEDPSHYAPFLLQGGLGMPDRDYYVSDSAHMHELQQQYKTYIAKLLHLSGDTVADADARVSRIYELERRIAEAHVARADSEDVQRGHNHWSSQDFANRAPGLDWKAFFAGAQLSKHLTFVVWQPTAVAGISALTKSVPISTWKEYLRFHAIDQFAGLLPKAFVDAQFAFYGSALQGTPQLQERWKRAVDDTSDALGDGVGQLYVRQYFPPQAKQSIDLLVQNLIAAFASHIDALEWMAPETRAQAKAKLAVLKVGVGYTDHWIDYSSLKVVAGDAYGNAERAALFHYRHELAKLTTPQVDRSEWVTTPQTVNAFNLPAMNAINFPAAILQAPFFDPNRPAVLNYGAIGAIIGHEISHSFDDQGAQFDADGKLHDWWTVADYAHFKQSSEQLVAQYNAYKPFPDLAVNGKQTLSENIADLAGLSVAYSAYRSSLGGIEAPALEGFTGDQQFFLSFAQTWHAKYREPMLRQVVISDGHSPEQYRALTVRNLDAWYKAFTVQPGQALYLSPAERVRMW
jgi:predicted metalloendopeptidase